MTSAINTKVEQTSCSVDLKNATLELFRLYTDFIAPLSQSARAYIIHWVDSCTPVKSVNPYIVLYALREASLAPRPSIRYAAAVVARASKDDAWIKSSLLPLVGMDLTFELFDSQFIRSKQNNISDYPQRTDSLEDLYMKF